MLKKWNIWSTEHMAWWRPASRGYTENRDEAGEYDFNEARKIVEDCHGREEHMVPAEAPGMVIQNLAMIVRRLAWRLHANDLAGSVVQQALDYLKRQGLNGNPLRFKDAENIPGVVVLPKGPGVDFALEGEQDEA